MSREIKDYTIGKRCSKCGMCCTNFLPITRKEKGRIRGYLSEHPMEPIKVEDGKLDIRCPFLNIDTRECRIYTARPGICRDFLCCKNNEALVKIKKDRHRSGEITDFREEFFGEENQLRQNITQISRAIGMNGEEVRLSLQKKEE